MLVMLLGALDQTIMAPALPAVAGDLGDLGQMPAVVTAYFVAATVVMPVYGKLGDRFGRRPLLVAAIGVFVAGAVLCALAQSIPALVVFRAIQGAGGGGLMIGAQAVIGEVVSPRERGRYLGLLGAVWVVAAVGGPIVGGFVIDNLGWRWIFAIYPPLGAVALVAVLRTLRLPASRFRTSIDYAGAATLATAVVALVLLTQAVGHTAAWPGWVVPVLATVTVAAGAAWVLTARRARDPILPLRLFRDPAFAIPTAISFLIGFTLFGTITYLPAYLQIARGSSATGAGLVLTFLMAGVIAAVIASGRLIARTGRYRAYPIVGTATATVGLALLATVDPSSAIWLVLVFLVLIGLGIGLTMQVMMLVAQNGVPHADLGTATSAVTFLRQIGAAAGVAAVGALITARFAAQLPPGAADLLPGGVGALTAESLAALPPAVHDAIGAAFGRAVPPVFGFVAPLLGLAFVLALLLPDRPLREKAHVDATQQPDPAERTAP